MTRTGVTARPPVWPRLVAIPGWRRTDRRHAPRRPVPFEQHGPVYLLREYWVKLMRELRSIRRRDILPILVGISRYMDIPPRLTPDLRDCACQTYFVEL